MEYDRVRRLAQERPRSLTPEERQDIENLEDARYLIEIMLKQGATGIFQTSDMQDALFYKEHVKEFSERSTPEGSVTDLFDDIIFDFDGVLYNSSHSVYMAVKLMLARKANKDIAAPETIHEIANSFHSPFQDYYRRFDIALDTPDEIASFKEAYRVVRRAIDEENTNPSTFYDEVKFVLDNIKEAKKERPSIRLHIVSASSRKHIFEALAQDGLEECFDEIHADCHDKAATIKNIAKQGQENKTVVIGDLPSDIKDAQYVDGVRTIAVARGERERERLGMYLPDYIVDNLEQLFDLKPYSKELRRLYV